MEAVEPTGARSETAMRKWRMWPGIALAAILVLVRFALPLVAEDAGIVAVLGSVLAGLLIVVWWAFFSRAPLGERFALLALLAVALAATSFLVHPSIATGMMGLMLPLYAIPLVAVALVAAAAVAQNRPRGQRRAILAGSILAVCGGFLLVRTAGMSSSAGSDFELRWAPTPEDRLLAAGDAPAAGSAGSAAVPLVADSEWPGFRGPRRDGIVPATAIAADWSLSPPAELWRRPIGPGWSSFAVRGDLIYTQEQRGEEEIVACYRASSGEPVWKHRDTARFWESNAGAGPRGTPTLHGDRVYTFGATGIVNALDAATGKVLWSRDAAKELAATTPTWGFSSSPLVYRDLVLVAVSGQLVAYDLESGAERWRGPAGGASYSSPHLASIGGVTQVVQLGSKNGVIGVDPDDGKVLWEHLWQGYPIVQPATTPDGDLLISIDDSSGTRRLHLDHQSGSWSAKELWTSIGLKPYFNDFVIHEGYAYGFDGGILAAIDIADGKRKWKGGRYGQGQLVLLPAQDLLLVLSEQGELALVSATPEKFDERARMPAIEGKTWNHPVLLGDLLLVRNDQEMAAFRMPAAGGEKIAALR